MSRVCSFSLCLAAWLASFATVHGDEAKSPRTDLYGDPLPPGAVARFGTVRLRHASSLFTFSADGKQLISFGAEGEIRVWEVATGKLHRSKWLWWEQPDLRETTRDGHSLRSRIDLTPDGTTAAALREDAIYIYDTATGELRRRISIEARDSNEWLELSLTFDGKLLTVVRWAEGKAAVTIQLWNVSTGKLRQSIKITIPEMRPIAHSSDGKYLLGMQKQNSDIHVWNTSTGKKVDRFERNVYGIPLFSPNNKLLAAVVDTLQVRLWDATTHREKAVLKVSGDVGNDCSLRSIAFSPDARFLAGDYDNSSSPSNKPKEGIVIWDVSKGREVRRFPESGVSSLALAPDGKTLACAGWDSEIRLWDVASGRQLHLRPGHSSLVRSLAVSPDGRVLASGAIGVRLWDTATGKQLRVFEQGDPEVLVSTDGTRVASTTRLSYNQDSIRVWEVATGKEVREVLITRPRFASDFSRLEAFGLSADGKRVTAVMFNNPPRATSVYHWRIDTGELLSKRSYAKDKHDPNVRASISPDGERLCLCRQGKVIIEDAETGRRPRTLHQAIEHRVVFSPDGRLVAAGNWLPRKGPIAGSDWNGISLIETTTGEEALLMPATETFLFAFTPDGRSLVAVDKKGLRVWDVATGKPLHRRAWPASILERQGKYDSAVYSLALLPDGRAATGMRDGTILLWDLAVKTWPANGLARELTSGELTKLWTDLAGEAAAAHRALYTLAASPSASLPFLNARFLHAALAEVKRIERLLADLDSDKFQEREAATSELIREREWMESTLRRMLANKPNAEVRRRLQTILTAKGPLHPISGNRKRTMRAIAVLELMGTPEARRILEKLASGAAAPESWAAQAALRRLNPRAVSAKQGATP